MAALSLGLARIVYRDQHPRSLWRASALVQALPVFSGLLLAGLAAGQPDLRFAEFGIFFLFFGVLGWWPWSPRARRPAATVARQDRRGGLQ
jgi:hypothetical protein